MNYLDTNDYELIYLIKEDNEQAQAILFKKYESLIKKIASSYYNSYKTIKIEYEDLIQEGMIGLCEAIKGFQLDKDVLFFTFAFLCIKRQMLAYLVKMQRNKNLLLLKSSSLDEEGIEKTIDYNDPMSFLEEKGIINDIINFKNSLDFTDANIFELRCNDFSYQQISDLLEIPNKAVDNKLLKIRKKLKKYLLELE